MKYPKNRLGFTLVELLVALTVFSIIITITLSVLFRIQRLQRELDKKYEFHKEIASLCKEMESSFKNCQRLILVSSRMINFLDIYGDTINYFLRGDTLYKDNNPFPRILFDSFSFSFVRLNGNGEIADLNSLDEDHNGVVSDTELTHISGIMIVMNPCYFEGFKKVKIEKNLFISFRNAKKF
jgi:prepilin-type N-terminal cleavage/methylation domain-containing protein